MFRKVREKGARKINKNGKENPAKFADTQNIKPYHSPKLTTHTYRVCITNDEITNIHCNTNNNTMARIKQTSKRASKGLATKRPTVAAAAKTRKRRRRPG